MKAFRAIKIFLLIVAIVCMLVSAAGNFFILKDACDNKITAEEVHKALDSYEFKIGSIFKGKAEDETSAQTPAENSTESETPAETPAENSADPGTAAEPETSQASAEETANGYKAGSHMGIVNGLMKAGNARINLSFLKDLKFNLCKAGTVGMRPTADGEDAEPAFEINLWLGIAFAALTLAFIIHLFTKNRRKNLWGILVMIFGYLLFTAFFAAGHVMANLDINQLIKTEITDFAAYRIYVICGCCILGVLMGIGFIRCGARSMKRRKRKNPERR